MITLHPVTECILKIGTRAVDDARMVCKCLDHESLGLLGLADVSLIEGVLGRIQNSSSHPWLRQAIETVHRRIAELLESEDELAIASTAKTLVSEHGDDGSAAVEGMIFCLTGPADADLRAELKRLLPEEEGQP